jgi:hypothetical protein
MASAKLVTARDFSPRRMDGAFAHEAGDHLRGAADLLVIAGQQEILVDAAAAQIAVSHADHDQHPALVLFVEAGFDANFAGKLAPQPVRRCRVWRPRSRCRLRYRGQAGHAALRRQ